MKNPLKTISRRALAATAALSVATLAMAACSPASTGDADESGETPVTLTFLSAFPETNQNNEGFWMFQKKLKETAPWVTIEYRGGPEVVEPTVLIESVQSGAIDGATLPGDYYVGQMPLMEIARFTPFTPTESRENGVYDLYVEAHDALGVHFVGHSNSGMPQTLFVKDKITSPDLSGKSLRVSAATSNMVLELGGTPVALPGTEIFTALERGTIDGTGWNSTGVTSLGFHTEVGYEIAPRFYESLQNVVINKAKWDSLNATTQDAIIKAMADVEPEIFEYYNNLAREEVKTWREAGMQRIDFDAEQTNEMLKIAYVSAWDALEWDKIVSMSPQAEEIRAKFEAAYDLKDLSKAVPGGAVVEPAE